MLKAKQEINQLASDSESDDMPSKLIVKPQKMEVLESDLLRKKLEVFQQIRERFQPSESYESHFEDI